MNLKAVKQLFAQLDDVIFDIHFFPDSRDVYIIYCKSMCDTQLIQSMIMPELQRLEYQGPYNDQEAILAHSTIQMAAVNNLDELVAAIFSGDAIIYWEQSEVCASVPICGIPTRQTDETNIEVSIRGPKDGLVEDIDTNIALIRKRLPVSQLANERHIIGNRTRTKIGFLYLKDKLDDDILALVREKLSSIPSSVEELTSANQLEELISDKPYSLFPLTAYTGRADFITSCLLKGRFAIVIDGVPGAIIAPATLPLLLKTPEDTHFNFLSSSLGRVLRLFSVIIAIMLPSFFIALIGFHQDQLPFPFLATIVLTRLGTPLPAPLEMLVVLVLLETFKEAGYRLPSMIGQTLTVVGGLIIGDAAIRAGILSPSIVVVGAIAMVAGSTLISQTLAGTVSVIRIIALLLSSMLGMYGFMLFTMLLVVYIIGLTSFGIPYLSPFSPLRLKEILSATFALPRKWMGRVPKSLRKGD
ncbi:spore germination protein [Paenibacillus sp. J5C_2022]|uniref:spore germination protein n=1 Tax=Paenibacillus sp. J5C2022 TaxID=2977129 RepID=UPI0021CF918C|nr:spore germination protein [Paenibacillus sp. J5C2022]MCU6712955.1 spore germination protein [Paenibacillus sp. J5C2022]